MPYVAFVAVAGSRHGIHLPLCAGRFQSNNHRPFQHPDYNSLIHKGFDKS